MHLALAPPGGGLINPLKPPILTSGLPSRRKISRKWIKIVKISKIFAFSAIKSWNCDGSASNTLFNPFNSGWKILYLKCFLPDQMNSYSQIVTYINNRLIILEDLKSSCLCSIFRHGTYIIGFGREQICRSELATFPQFLRFNRVELQCCNGNQLEKNLNCLKVICFRSNQL